MASHKQAAISKKTTFLLKNIDPNKIDTTYGIAVGPTTEDVLTTSPSAVQATTMINTLSSNQKHPSAYVFIDQQTSYCVTMIDRNTYQPAHGMFCYWCVHPFSSIPLGCPIDYIPNKMVKRCTSEITKEQYAVKQPTLYTEPPTGSSSSLTFVPYDYYLTDGIFCSFNCCIAYIDEHCTNPLYKHSKYLLMQMYRRIFQDDATMKRIEPTPSWRLLKEFGGHLTIDAFRSNVNECVYVEQPYRMKTMPTAYPIGKVFEEYHMF